MVASPITLSIAKAPIGAARPDSNCDAGLSRPRSTHRPIRTKCVWWHLGQGGIWAVAEKCSKTPHWTHCSVPTVVISPLRYSTACGAGAAGGGGAGGGGAAAAGGGPGG